MWTPAESAFWQCGVYPGVLDPQEHAFFAWRQGPRPPVRPDQVEVQFRQSVTAMCQFGQAGQDLTFRGGMRNFRWGVVNVELKLSRGVTAMCQVGQVGQGARV
jgi:hypothetical protein